MKQMPQVECDQSFTVFHFMPMTHDRGALAVAESLMDSGVAVVLDLEDSVSCLFDPERNDRLKAKARAGLLRFASKANDNLKQADALFVRINSSESSHYAEDIKAIAMCYRQELTPGIVLPKVHSADDVLSCQQDILWLSGITPRIVPILETMQAIDLLESIIDRLPDQNRMALFGYFDYALNAQHWPLLAQMQPEYWQLFDSIRERAERVHCSLMNAPYDRLVGEDDMLKVKAHLLSTASLPTGMCSVGMSQTKTLLRPVRPGLLDEMCEASSVSDPVLKAQSVVSQFEASRRHQRSFTVCENDFIPPHEYLLAKRFLDKVP